MAWVFCCCCSELIDKLVRATDLKFGRGVGNVVSRYKFNFLEKYLNLPSQKVTKPLAN